MSSPTSPLSSPAAIAKISPTTSKISPPSTHNDDVHLPQNYGYTKFSTDFRALAKDVSDAASVVKEHQNPVASTTSLKDGNSSTNTHANKKTGHREGFQTSGTFAAPSDRIAYTSAGTEESSTYSHVKTPPQQTIQMEKGMQGATLLSQLDKSLRISRSPKRHLPADSGQADDRIRKQFDGDFASPAKSAISSMRDSLSTAGPSSFRTSGAARPHLTPVLSNADSMTQASGSADADTLQSSGQVAAMIREATDETLILDLRASSQYVRSRIRGALNVCVPTTLLKRPAFTIEKIVDTFNDDAAHKRSFQRWRSCKNIVVYDTRTSQLRDAANCVSFLRKFVNEGWIGRGVVLRGGFAEFEGTFPNLVDRSDLSHEQAKVSTQRSPSHSLAPVIGGCSLPSTSQGLKPFFGNIRQNTDLIDGVGQIPIRCPRKFQQEINRLPRWLSEAADPDDQGRSVASRFLGIERREQGRMQRAFDCTLQNPNGSFPFPTEVEIAGIEKGAKNRYNNIWPYEHTRVKLKDVISGGCDYINASSIRTNLSRKRYIATQGPIPATFADFWHMVWQQNVRVIVMLTAESESGQIKAHNYWSQSSHGSMRIEQLSEKTLDLMERPSQTSTSHFHENGGNPEGGMSMVVRRFALSHSTKPFERMREIVQLQYAHWPDFGAPANPLDLLALVESCDAFQDSATSDKADEHPMIVHCSAGCGRTGTFCTIDTVIEALKRERTTSVAAGNVQESVRAKPLPETNKTEFRAPTPSSADYQLRSTDLVEATVEELRLQRASMVQNLRQYVLCYETILEWLAREEARDVPHKASPQLM